MTEQHKKADGTLTTNGVVPVFSPMNAGKNIKWDPATKAYYVPLSDKFFDIDELGNIKLRLSNLENNMLRERDDGLYMGVQARSELRNLYVDAINGIDQNPLEVEGAGTRAKPLKTVAYALRQAERNTERTVYLKENQDHILDLIRDGVINLHTGHVRINIYGEEWDRSEARVLIDWKVRWREFYQRGLFPRLKFTGVDVGTYLDQYTRLLARSINVPTDTTLSIDNVSIFNDVSGNFVEAKGLEGKGIRLTELNRITTSLGGQVYMHYVAFTQTVNIVKNGTPSEDEKISVGFVYPANGRLVLERIIDFSPNFTGKIVGHQGWLFPLNGISSVSIKNAPAENTKLSDIASKITIYQRDPQNNVILAPTVDVPSSNFS